MEKDGLVFSHIRSYLHSVRREREGALGEFERECRRRGLPVSDEETSDLLEILCLLRRPRRIIEIGTCVGFSALLMNSVCPEAEIITLERNPVMIAEAEKNFAEFGAADKITLINGDAAEVLVTVPGKADLIFIDAAKGQYDIFFPECMRLLSPNGVLVADNVLFNGMVATGVADTHRNKTIINRLESFVTSLEKDERLKTVLLPISDGVAVSFRKGD